MNDLACVYPTDRKVESYVGIIHMDESKVFSSSTVVVKGWDHWSRLEYWYYTNYILSGREYAILINEPDV